MKLMTVLLLSFFFLSPAHGQEDIIPIYEASVGGLLGGARNGKYFDAEAASKALKKGDRLAGFGLFGKGRSYLATKIANDQDVCTDFFYIETKPTPLSGIAFGKGLNWNPLPRLPRKLGQKNKAIQRAAASFIIAQKIKSPKVAIKQAYRVDLDGDGKEEQLIGATLYTGGRFGAPNAGDYSFIMLRKMVSGKMRSFLVDGEFYPQRGESAPNSYKLSAIADLNGDGKMEIVVHSSYYEGSSTAAFEWKAGKAELISKLSVGCGV